jgi:bifunctional non-homologous end joining protein LigD
MADLHLKEVHDRVRLTNVEFTNLDKVLYPEIGVTKAQVIEHYIRLAPKMLDQLGKRPITLTRFPNGLDGGGFYEKDAPMGTPSWVDMFKKYSETAKREINYVVCNGLDTLVWLGNLATLEIHMTLSTVDSFESPDLVLFDIDPEPPATSHDLINTALLLKEKLDALGLRSYVKTSGKQGMHVVIPIVAGYTFQQTRNFVHQIGKLLSQESEIVVSELSKSKDAGTIFIDYLQNSHGRTMVCPYSLRATPKATVSTPIEWADVKKGLNPEEFNILNVAKIQKDPWKELLRNKQKLVVN